MKKSKKYLGVTATAIVTLFGAVSLGGCAVSSGITHLGDGKVAVSLNGGLGFFAGNKTPIVYDCSSGSTCIRIGQ